MKLVITLIAVFLFSIIHGQKTYVPDLSFENYLETHNSIGDSVALGDPTSMGDGILGNDSVFTSSINTISELKIFGLGIADLTGIDSFAALMLLDVSSNQLDSLEISNSNMPLYEINCGNNQIDYLNIDGVYALTSFMQKAFDSSFKHLYVMNNTHLSTLDCSNNYLQKLI